MLLLACHTKDFISRGEIEAYPQYPIYMVITNDGEVYEFEPSVFLEGNLIRGTLKDGTSVEIPIEQVNMVYAKKFDQSRSGAALLFGTGATALTLALVVVGIGAMVLLILVVGAAAGM
jgi:hypothetical protein